jgi:hypothetical protein
LDEHETGGRTYKTGGGRRQEELTLQPIWISPARQHLNAVIHFTPFAL